MCTTIASAQYLVSGTIKDWETGEALIGVNVYLEGTVIGTITGLDGKYSIYIDQSESNRLVCSLVGFQTQTIEITESISNMDLLLKTKALLADEIVVSASRFEQSVLESPITIEKLDLIAIKQSSSLDYYDELNRMKGVSNTQASLTFNSINTRGFSGNGNTRFVQLQDGMDNATPLLNFPTGNIVGISELDIKSIELIPGPASALYGPNAFNGILLMNSKDPFDYSGLSAQVKLGATDGNTTDPLFGASLRYAKTIREKFAFKLNASTLWAQDWEANDYSTQRSSSLLGELNPSNPKFDGINLYGDEIRFNLSGLEITRTGLAENILLESRAAQSFKFDAAIHYRINGSLESNISYKWGSGSTVYQGAERYALRNFVQQFAKWELNSPNWNIRAYTSQSNAGDSYNLTALGTLPYLPSEDRMINLGYNGATLSLPYSAGWSTAVGLALNGDLEDILNISPNNLPDAINFADLGGSNLLDDAQKEQLVQAISPDLLPSLESLITIHYPDLNAAEVANSLITQWRYALVNGSSGPSLLPDQEGNYSPELLAAIAERRNRLFQNGGAGFVDNSGLYHVEGNYDLSHLLPDDIGLQAGANWRLYSLFSDGTIFNEDFDSDGNNNRILINEGGAYIQASKKLFQDKMNLSASMRFDKNQNFEGQISPRVSMVYALDQDKLHNLRASFQTGFRNPSTQAQYIYFPSASILLGGSRENAEQYGIFEGGAWSYASYLRSLRAGNEEILETIFIDYLRPEQLRTIELGYKGFSDNRFLIDFNVHFNQYDDFIYQDNVVSKQPSLHRGEVVPAGTIYRPYFNAPVNISSWGSSIGLDFLIFENWRLASNASYNNFSFDKEQLPLGYENFNPGFNTPSLKTNLGIFNRKIVDRFGMGINYQWQNEFEWFSSFGVGTIPAYGKLDMQISTNLNAFNSTIKLGINNVFNKRYLTNYGGPRIGRMFHLTLTYDQFKN